jgi:hypothetical protein
VLLRTLLVLRKLSAELAYHLWTATLVYYGLDGAVGSFSGGRLPQDQRGGAEHQVAVCHADT